MKTFFLALVAGFFVGSHGFSEAVKNVRGNLGTDRIIDLPISSMTREAANILADVDDYGNSETGTHMRVAYSSAAALESAGIEYKDVTEEWISKLEANFNGAAEFVCEDSAANCAARANFYDSYQRLDALHLRLDQIAANSGGLGTIGSMGTSYEGRDQKLIYIEDPSGGKKPVVFYMCGIHSREWLPIHFCTYMAETLVANGGHPLLQKVKFIIIPVLNPDGYEYTHTNDNLWRKSRKPNPFNSCVGTDLNRNYDIKHCEEGASTNPCSQTYCGVTPFDNIEVKNQQTFFNNLRAQGEEILVTVDVHAKGMMWMSPYGYTRALPPAADYNRMTFCGQKGADGVRSVNGLDFEVGSIANVIYVVSGGSKDWMYEVEGVVYSWGLEVRGDVFQPTADNIVPSNLELFKGMEDAVSCAYAVEYEGLEVPDASGGGEDCEDSVPSGLQFSDGTSVECTELPSYCADYEIVRERCPSTCGLCTAPCVDNVPSGLTYTSGAPAPCNEIERYCSTYQSVRDACPATCGTCPANAIAAKYQEDMLVMTIDRIESEEGSAALYGAIAVAGVGFVGAVAALVVVARRIPKRQEPVVKVQSAQMYDL